VTWVEQGVPPATLPASGGSAAPPTGRTRPLCPYPQTAIYNGGSANPDIASSFHCGGKLATTEAGSARPLPRYTHQNHGTLDFTGTGLKPSDCHVKDQDDQQADANNQH